MRRLTLSGVALFALAHGSALAADLPVKVPLAPAAVVAYNWTGAYLGGHVGYAQTARDDSNADLFATGFGFFAPPGLPFNTGGSSVLGGAQAGYNWQIHNRWLIGVEGDFSGSDVGGSQTYSPIPPGPTGGLAAAPAFVTMSRDVNWLASARARLGLTWDRVLVYATGGAAWIHADYLGQSSRAGGTFTETASFSKTSTGWVVGGGLEYGLTPNWTIRGEYLYYTTPGASAIGVESNPIGVIATFNWDRTNLHVARLAINYRFGQGPLYGM